MKRLVCAIFFLVWLPGNAQAEPTQSETLNWLKKIEAASHQLNYSGVFVYQSANLVETSRITHYMDDAGEHEKLEALDGPPKETIRHNDEVWCYLPESKTIRVEKRNTRKFFPALLPKDVSQLTENYTINLGKMERIAGFDCQSITLVPKDDFRFAHIFCADATTSLLLKAALLNNKNEVLDQFAFTQLNIGGQIDKSQFKPKPAWKTLTWHTDKTVVLDARNNETGWQVKQPPSGFLKTMEMKRAMPGKKSLVSHLVYADGLATVSVFIEPLAGMAQPMQGFSSQGAINVYAKLLPDYQVTAIGAVPAATLMQMANSIARTGR